MAQTIPIDAYLGAHRSGLAIGATIYQLDGTTVHSAFSTAGWYEAPSGSGDWHHPGLSFPDAGGVVAVGISGTEYMRESIEARQLLHSEYAAPPSAAQIRTEIDSYSTQLAKLGTPNGTSLSADVAAVKTDTAAILLDTGTDGVVVATASKTGYALSSAGVQAIWDTLTSALTAVGSIGRRIADNLNATVDSRATPANVTSAQAAITAAIAALNNLSIADIDARLTAYDGATQTDLTATQTAITNAIAALNNLSQTQAQSAAAAALNAYDPPTKLELDSAVGPLALQTTANAIKAKTDNLPGAPAAASDIPGTAAIASAILAASVESGHDLTTVLRAVYAIVRNKSVANNGDNPTQIDYFAPDGTTLRVRHNLNDTERTPA